MDRRASTSWLVFITVLLALAGPVAAGMKATFAAGVGVADTAVLRRLMTTRLEDGVAPELMVDLEVHRRVLAGGFVKPNTQNPDRAACLGPCPASGGPYIGRSCSPIYHCVTGPPKSAVSQVIAATAHG